MGSTSLTTDQSGAVVAETRYLPYGQERWTSGATRTDFGFTGQRKDGFGLMDYNARYYSPVLGRFVSPDTIVPGPGNPQAWNRYAYTFNNPLNHTDSSGHCPPCDDPWAPLRSMWDQALSPDNKKAIADSMNKALTVSYKEVSYLAGETAAFLPPPLYDNNIPGLSTLPKPENPVWPFDESSFNEGLHSWERAAADGIQIGVIIPENPLFKPGPHADPNGWINATGSKVTRAQSRKIQGLGDEYGCHSCGAKKPRPDGGGRWRGDHQPPTSIANGAPQRLYPQCESCSNTQGGFLSWIAKMMKGEKE